MMVIDFKRNKDVSHGGKDFGAGIATGQSLTCVTPTRTLPGDSERSLHSVKPNKQFSCTTKLRMKEMEAMTKWKGHAYMVKAMDPNTAFCLIDTANLEKEPQSFTTYRLLIGHTNDVLVMQRRSISPPPSQEHKRFAQANRRTITRYFHGLPGPFSQRRLRHCFYTSIAFLCVCPPSLIIIGMAKKPMLSSYIIIMTNISNTTIAHIPEVTLNATRHSPCRLSTHSAGGCSDTKLYRKVLAQQLSVLFESSFNMTSRLIKLTF